MKKMTLVIAACATLLLGVALAQDENELAGVMKTVGANNGMIRKAIAAKDASATEASAAKLSEAFEKVQAHFEEHHMEDGVNFAKTAHNAAMAIDAAAKAGEWEKASEEAKTMGGSCQGCHAAHREKMPDGTYKMK